MSINCFLAFSFFFLYGNTEKKISNLGIILPILQFILEIMKFSEVTVCELPLWKTEVSLKVLNDCFSKWTRYSYILSMIRYFLTDHQFNYSWIMLSFWLHICIHKFSLSQKTQNKLPNMSSQNYFLWRVKMIFIPAKHHSFSIKPKM